MLSFSPALRQVSILGVNFLGEGKETNNNRMPAAAPQRSGSAPLTQDGVSSYDDLAFNMYTDYDAVKWMRKLEARKTVAAKREFHFCYPFVFGNWLMSVIPLAE